MPQPAPPANLGKLAETTLRALADAGLECDPRQVGLDGQAGAVRGRHRCRSAAGVPSRGATPPPARPACRRCPEGRGRAAPHLVYRRFSRCPPGLMAPSTRTRRSPTRSPRWQTGSISSPVCSAWDFGLLPERETVEEIRRPEWREAVDATDLLTSPVYHLLRSWHGLPQRPYLGQQLAYIRDDPSLEHV